MGLLRSVTPKMWALAAGALLAAALVVLVAWLVTDDVESAGFTYGVTLNDGRRA